MSDLDPLGIIEDAIDNAVAEAFPMLDDLTVGAFRLVLESPNRTITLTSGNPFPNPEEADDE